MKSNLATSRHISRSKFSLNNNNLFAAFFEEGSKFKVCPGWQTLQLRHCRQKLLSNTVKTFKMESSFIIIIIFIFNGARNDLFVDKNFKRKTTSLLCMQIVPLCIHSFVTRSIIIVYKPAITQIYTGAFNPNVFLVNDNGFLIISLWRTLLF